MHSPEPLIPDLWMSLFKSAGMLCVVLAALILFLYLLKRLSMARGLSAEKDMIRLVASFHLAPKERVVLLDVMGEKILLGVTPSSITRLAVIEDDGMVDEVENRSDSSFVDILRKAAGGKGKSGSREDNQEGINDSAVETEGADRGNG